MRSFIGTVALSAAILSTLGCDKPPIDQSGASSAPSQTASSSGAASGPVDAARLDAAKGFNVGGASVMSATAAYVLFDPQCPHCGELWANARPLAGQVKLKWIPVSLLGPKSVTQSAMLLEAKDPVELMTKHENEMRSTGVSLVLEGKPSKTSQEEVERNTELLKQSGATSVPTIFYRDPQGQLAMTSGSKPTAALAALLGVPVPQK